MAVGPARSVSPTRFGSEFELDTQNYVLRRSGRTLKLERIPMEVLLVLIERAGQLVTREQIVERVWGKGVHLDTDNSINSAIRKIRLVLRDNPDQPRFVQTVVGRGYIFLQSSLEGQSGPQPAPKAVEQPPENQVEGRRVGDYRILQLLGGGGMGVVYKAEDLKLGRQVAIKFLSRELASDPVELHRIKQEARLASSLDHPHICSVYQFGESEGQPFIVMPLLEGQTLREWISAEAFRPATTCVRELVSLGIQISQALEFAHKKGIVHRDIKPANIFLTSRGEIKILDFGVASVRGTTAAGPSLVGGEAASELTRTTLSPGTPAYLSPEQVRGESVDARSDLFSFGSVLYEMATGQRAFKGDSVTAIEDAIVSAEPRPIHELKEGIPLRFEEIVAKTLAKDRERRYKSAQQVREDLEEVLVGLNTPRFWRRNRLIAIAALIAVAALGSWAIHRWRRAATPDVVRTSVVARRSVAVMGFRNLSGKPDQDWISTALAEILSNELASGQQLRVVPGESVSHLKKELSLPPPESYSAQTLDRIHRNLGADLVVLGSYLPSGEPSSGKIHLDVRVQDASSGETIAAFTQSGSEQEIADLASDAGATLRHKLGLQAVADSQRDAKGSLPANEEAVRLYSLGLEKLRTFDASGARDVLLKAIAADPNFAPSHSALAESLSALGYDLQARSEAKEAFDLSRNASRENQLLIEARYRELTRDLPAAVDAYRTLWKFFPDDINYGLHLASAQIKAGTPRDALATVSQLRALPAPQADDPRIDLAEAKAAEAISDFRRGVQAASNAESKAKQLGSQLVLADALERKAYLASDLGQQDSALSDYEQARSIWMQAGDQRGAASALHSIAVLQYRAGDFEASQKSFEEALTVFKQLGSMWDIASCSNNYAILLTDWGKLPEAKAALEQALQIQRNLKDKRGVASDLDDLSNVLMAMGELNLALRDKEEALQLFREVENPSGEAVTLTNLGDLFVSRGDLVNARQSFEQALALKQKLGLKRGIPFVLSGLVEVSIRQDRLAEARQLAVEAIDLRKQLRDAYSTAISELQLADVDMEQGNIAEAEGLVRTSLTLFDKQRSTRDSAIANALLARVLLKVGKVKEAQLAAARAQSLAKPSGDVEAEFNAELADAEVKSASRDLGEALPQLRNVASRANKRGFRGEELDAHLLIGSAEMTSGQLNSGRAHLSQVEKDATAAGFALIARKAHRMRVGSR